MNLLTKEDIVIDYYDEDGGQYSETYNPYQHCIVYNGSEKLEICFIEGTEISERISIPLNLQNLQNIGILEDYYVSGDGNYLYLQIITDSDDGMDHYVYDLRERKLEKFIENPPIISESRYSVKTVMSKTGSIAAVFDAANLSILDLSEKKVLSVIPMDKDIDDIGFAFFSNDPAQPDSKLVVSDLQTILLYDVSTGELLDSLYFNAEEKYFEKNTGGFDVRTDESGEFFSIMQDAWVHNTEHGSNLRGEFVFSVDQNLRIAPYTEIAFGYTDFAKRKVMVLGSDQAVYSADIYDDAYLINKAEEVLRIHSAE